MLARIRLKAAESEPSFDSSALHEADPGQIEHPIPDKIADDAVDNHTNHPSTLVAPLAETQELLPPQHGYHRSYSNPSLADSPLLAVNQEDSTALLISGGDVASGSGKLDLLHPDEGPNSEFQERSSCCSIFDSGSSLSGLSDDDHGSSDDGSGHAAGAKKRDGHDGGFPSVLDVDGSEDRSELEV